MSITTDVKKTICQYNMIQPGDKIIVALSGGADSVCLFKILFALKDELGITLEACHINHKLRGNQSDSDAKFVDELCKSLNVFLHMGVFDVKSLQKKHQSLEECARNVRYSFFEDIGENAKIATAHTANDNTETVFLNMIRGTALRGLCGIPPVRENIIRPLINTTKSEILDFLTDNNISYVTDESNFSEEFTRNNIRLNIIPILEKINPSLFSGISKLCECLRDDEEFLNKIAINAENEAKEDNSYKVSKLINLPAPILSRIISSVLSKNNISPNYLNINSIISILESGGKINLKKNKFAEVKNGMFCVNTIHQNYRKKT